MIHRLKDFYPIVVTDVYPLHDESFGQRCFGLIDSAGMWVDVVEQIEPAAGWWDRYSV